MPMGDGNTHGEDDQQQCPDNSREQAVKDLLLEE